MLSTDLPVDGTRREMEPGATGGQRSSPLGLDVLKSVFCHITKGEMGLANKNTLDIKGFWSFLVRRVTAFEG